MEMMRKQITGLICRRRYWYQSLSCFQNSQSRTKTTLPDLSSERYNAFDEYVSARHLQALRTIVVQVNSEKSFKELYNYCSKFGQIIGAQHYCTSQDEVQHYVLLEYANIEEASSAIDSSVPNDELSSVTARSPFLWFRAFNSKLNANISLPAANLSSQTAPELLIIDGCKIVDQTKLTNILRSAADIEDQINLLYQHTKLNDLGIRLRFLAACQLQQAISGMFPDANALPFGSSVSGFGKMGCDLDLILRLGNISQGYEAQTRKSNSRLVFHTKENLTNGRSQMQRQMESIGDLLQLFLPGVCHVRRILQARVPIIKYHHEHLNLEIDMSMSNLTGFYMSELLYMFGEMDKRVRPLTFCVRRWANCCGLTNPSPGRWITNFSLTCLVIFFLQQSIQPVLPAINSLIKIATPNDVRLTEDGINCTFARNLRLINFQSTNKQKMSELLLQFFEFYAQFDFHNKAISLNEGRAIAKPEHSPLYIVNPLELSLNVSKNVSLEECERFRIEVRNAAWILESELEPPSLQQDYITSANDKTCNKDVYSEDSFGAESFSWGVLNIFKTPDKKTLKSSLIFKPRILEVSELFNRNENDDYDQELCLDENQSRHQHLNQNRSNKSTFKSVTLNTSKKVVTANKLSLHKSVASRKNR